MISDNRFKNQDKSFWACVRSLSQDLGYTVWGQDLVKVPTVVEMQVGFIKLGLNPDAIVNRTGKPTELANLLYAYFEYRARVLNEQVQRNLMNGEQAKALYQDVLESFERTPKCPRPMNKQKNEKKDFSFLTCIVNMLIEKHSQGADCDYDPRKLTTITKDGVPLRTLARRVDGAFPKSVNPVAIWR